VDFIKFLGTAGARHVVAQQLRASGGIWFSYKSTNLLIDPAPGTLVRIARSRPKLDPGQLDGLILTHRHLDHSGDINIMIEAVTNGGLTKRGKLFTTVDSLNEDPVILQYLRGFLEEIVVLKEKNNYSLKDVKFSVPVRNDHPVETYGLIFYVDGNKIALVSDTLFFPKLITAYKSDILILNLVRYKQHDKFLIKHLNVEDAGKLIKGIKPRLCILSHFGRTMIAAKPWIVAENLSKETGVEVIAAGDGFKLEYRKYL